MRRAFDPDKYAECLKLGHIWSVTTHHCRHCGVSVLPDLRQLAATVIYKRRFVHHPERYAGYDVATLADRIAREAYEAVGQNDPSDRRIIDAMGDAIERFERS